MNVHKVFVPPTRLVYILVGQMIPSDAKQTLASVSPHRGKQTKSLLLFVPSLSSTFIVSAADRLAGLGLAIVLSEHLLSGSAAK